MSSGSATRSSSAARAAIRIDVPRQLAALPCAGLVIAPFCAWMTETAVTRGLHGSLRLHQTMSGWQSLSGSAIVAFAVALTVAAVLIAGAARPRARAGRRREASTVAGGGLLVTLTAIWTLAAHEGHSRVGPATVTHAVGFGVVLALACGLALLALGIWMLQSPSRADGEPVRTGARRTRRAR